MSSTVKEQQKPVSIDTEKMMKVYQQLGTPGEPHRNMARLAGTWDVRTRAWVSPDKPPRESTGTSEQSMVLDGHYLLQKQSGSMAGKPFSGIGYNGYDNNTKRYVTTWMDSMSTSILYFEGTASADGSTVTQECLYDDPIMGPMRYRIVTKFVNDDTYTFEMSGIDKSGNEIKMMEATYTRQK